MNEENMQKKISVLKCPRFWRERVNGEDLRTNLLKWDVKYDRAWGHLYNSNCQIYKRKNECKEICKHRNYCKLYVMNGEEGVTKMKRMNVNVKLPSRGTAGAAGYDLAAAETAVVPVHGKCLVKTGLAMALPPSCYGRIAPQSGLALKKFY